MCWKGCSCDLLNTAQGNTEVLRLLSECEGVGVGGGHKRKQGFFFFQRKISLLHIHWNTFCIPWNTFPNSLCHCEIIYGLFNAFYSWRIVMFSYSQSHSASVIMYVHDKRFFTDFDEEISICQVTCRQKFKMFSLLFLQWFYDTRPIFVHSCNEGKLFKKTSVF